MRGVDGLLCLLTDRIDGEVMDAAGPGLKVISNHAVGVDNIDLEAATARGIPVGNTPGILTDATADFAFALLLAAARRAGSLAPCVMISGYATLDRAIEAVRLGAYDFLTKPFRLAQLDVILERLQSEQRLTRENHRLHHQNSRLDELRAAVVEGLAHVHARLDRIEQHLGIKRDK